MPVARVELSAREQLLKRVSIDVVGGLDQRRDQIPVRADDAYRAGELEDLLRVELGLALNRAGQLATDEHAVLGAEPAADAVAMLQQPSTRQLALEALGVLRTERLEST
jgi:hypothetical protein